jgi:type I restriction enzyme, S subunit
LSAKFAQYPSYGSSGVVWLGDIPSHWDLKRIKYIAEKIGSGKTPSGGAERYTSKGVTFIRSQNVRNKGIDLTDVAFIDARADQEQAFSRVQSDDVLLNITGASLGRCCLAPAGIEPANVNQHVCIIRLRNSFEPSFLWRSITSSSAQAQIFAAEQGISREGLNFEQVGNIVVAVPPQSEQKHIAAFLDRETVKIDTLVEKQQRMINLLEEKRRAVVACAVTKGLSPSTALRSSDVDWIGDIPKHWQVKPLNQVTSKITNGYVGPTRDILVESGIPYLQSLHIKDNNIVFDSEYFVTPEWSNAHAKSVLVKGDVLIVQTGDIGQVAVVPKGYVGANCHALIIAQPIKTIITGEFLGWLLWSSYGLHSLLSRRTGATHPHLNCGNIKDISVPIPPLNEQESIVRHIEQRSRQLEKTLAAARSFISVLEAYQRSLITAAVTGKVDVRNAADFELSEEPLEAAL